MKTLLLSGLASAILLHTLPATARADGERGSRAETERYAQREAKTPQLDTFKGGGCWDPGAWIILLIPLALAFAPFYLLYEGGAALVELCTPRKPEPPKSEPRPKPVSLLWTRVAACV